MACKCEPGWNKGGPCQCDNSPPLPGGSPQRALHFATCPLGDKCKGKEKRISKKFSMPPAPRQDEEADFEMPEVNIRELCRDSMEFNNLPENLDTSCVSLEHRRRAPCAKPLSAKTRKPICPALGPEVPRPLPPCKQEAKKRPSRKLDRTGRKQQYRRSVECTSGPDVRVPCGVGSSSNEKGKQCNGKANVGKPCSSDKRCNMLKTKLQELLREIEPIPESCLLESTESKPEPEVLAEVLLMSEAEGIDLGEIKPDNVFNTLFSDVTQDQSIAITSAAPESMSEVVVPVQISGEESFSYDIPNSEIIIERVRGEAPPNLNAFQQSDVYEQFTEHVNRILERTPPTENISELLGESTLNAEVTKDEGSEDGILDYVMKPGPPSFSNSIRLNGSMRPQWFPGYTTVSPFIPGYMRTTDDPSEALREAWRLCHPRYFDDRSRTIVTFPCT